MNDRRDNGGGSANRQEQKARKDPHDGELWHNPWTVSVLGIPRVTGRESGYLERSQHLINDKPKLFHSSSSSHAGASTTPLPRSVAARSPSPDPGTASVAPDDDGFELIESDTEDITDLGKDSDPAPEHHWNQLSSKLKAKARKIVSRRGPASASQAQQDDEEEDCGEAIEGASVSDMEPGNEDDYNPSQWTKAGPAGDATDLAGIGEEGSIKCTVTKPLKEGEGAQNAYTSYLVTTDTDFKSFQASHATVRRRFTDFLFLYKTLLKEYPQCAVPPLAEKHNLTYLSGDRFSSAFTARRAFSLQRFLTRLTLHPVLRRAVLLNLFLESSDWNAVMKSRPSRAMSGGESSGSSVLESWTDNFLNAFTKVHKTDKRFTEVDDRAKKLDEDLNTVSKTVARVAKRDADLEVDYSDLSVQFVKLATLEPGLTDELTSFSTCLKDTSEFWKVLKEHTEQNYLGSLKDMESYSHSVKTLMRTREQKQLDFEGLTEYLTKAAQERDTLASHGNLGASGFLRQKIEDVRGVDHEQARRERQRKLEVQISRLTTEVDGAKTTSEAFDTEVVKEVGDFEVIKGKEFKGSLEGLADANIEFHKNNVNVWEEFIKEIEDRQKVRKAAAGGEAAGVGVAG
ncbi:intercellular trafficking and secretion [Oleoguttula sp. CCFEE 5521]